MDERCNQIMNCKDKSDEVNCKLISFEENYGKKVPPFTINEKDYSLIPAMVRVSTQLMNVLAISEFSHTIDLKLGITLEWYENRVFYHNLKSKEALNILSDMEVCFVIQNFYNFSYVNTNFQVESIWIPYIIFKNTDTDEAVTLETKTVVSVTKQGDFSRSGPEVADEVTFHVYSIVAE